MDLIKNKLVIPFSPLVIKVRQWAFLKHDYEVNQYYDKEDGLKYSYHLQMVADVAIRFSYLLDTPQEIEEALVLSYVHDIIEDARCTFNDLKTILGTDTAMRVINLTVDPRGLTKEARLTDEYYENLNKDFITAYVKLCDRIANVEHASLTNSIRPAYRDLTKIKKHFTDPRLVDLISYLNKLVTI